MIHNRYTEFTWSEMWVFLLSSQLPLFSIPSFSVSFLGNSNSYWCSTNIRCKLFRPKIICLVASKFFKISFSLPLFLSLLLMMLLLALLFVIELLLVGICGIFSILVDVWILMSSKKLLNWISSFLSNDFY